MSETASKSSLVVNTLPYDYEIEWLKSDGEAYLDLDLISPAYTGFHIKFSTVPSATTNIAGLTGTQYGNTARFGIWTEYTQHLQGKHFAGFSQDSAVEITHDSDIHEILAINGQGITVDQKFTPFPRVDVRKDMGLLLFSIVHSASGSEPYGRKTYSVYFAKYFNDNGEVVRDLIPVRKGLVGGMYDRVSGRLFTNVGPSNFELGPDI